MMVRSYPKGSGSLLKRVAGSMLIGLAVTACGLEREPAPTNKVVVILDRSGTYQKRLGAAISRVMTLLDALAQTKLRRWDRASDTIVVISLDAMPEVIWRGSLQELKALDRGAWTSRLQGRSDYAQCTDVEAAFRLAAQHLEGDSRVVHKYLFAFSDLIHEPPTASLGICQAPTSPSVPSETFPWDALRDVQTKIFWVPPDQKLAWSRAVAEQGLEKFALYTTSEAATVTLVPPSRPKVIRTDADQQASREHIAGTFWTWVSRIVALGLVIVGVILGGLWLGRRGGRPLRHPSAPRRGPVPPLPASALRRPGGSFPDPHTRDPRPPFPAQSVPNRGERSTPNGHHGL